MGKIAGELTNRIKEVRKGRRLTLEQLEEATGISSSYLSRMEAGKRSVSLDNLEVIARALGVPPHLLLPADPNKPAAEIALDETTFPGLAPDYSAVARDLKQMDFPPLPESNAELGEQVKFPRRRLPVFGHAVAGDDGRFELNGQRIADVLCPPGLENVRGAYAVYVHGSSMEPRYYPGETVWVHPHMPVGRGDFVVAQIQNDAEGEPPLGFVKQFISRSSRELVLEQFNPPEGQDRLMRFPGDRVISIHKIVFAGQS